MFTTLKILYHQGKQFIPDLRKAKVPGIFTGRPELSNDKVDIKAFIECCPTEAISAQPVGIDLGKCTFCRECVRLFPGKVNFTTDY